MTYGTIKVDTITFTDAGIDKSVTLSGLVQNPTFSGNVTVTGTLSGVTVTGTTANFTSGNFTNISGGTHTITSGVFAAGSAASPSITFTGDLNTGLYSPGADQVAISTGGSGRLFVDASGRLGVGTSSPVSTLSIRNDSLGSGGLTETAIALTYSSTNYGQHFIDANGTYNIYANNNGVAGGNLQLRADTGLIFNTASNERLRITSAGLVGIGTSSPTFQLDLKSSANSTFLHTQDSTGTYRAIYGVDSGGGVESAVCGTFSNHAFIFRTNNTERARIDTAGRLGIGTTSPQEELHIAAASQPYIQVESTGGVAGSAFYGYNSSTGSASIESTGSIRFAIPGSEAARIDSSGRLLVGTSTARQGTLFEIESTSGVAAVSITRNSNNSAGPSVVLAKTRSSSNGASSFGKVSADDALGGIDFYGADGAALINAASIYAYADGEFATGGDTTDGPGRLVFSTTADGASSPTERMRITNNGAVRIGATAAANAERFYLKGNAADAAATIHQDTTSSITQIFFLNPNGNVGSITTSGSATAYNTSSDYRLKENVEPVIDGITRLQQLKPSRFNFIADPDRIVDGFIAHEVQSVVPEAINGEKDAVDDDGNPIYQGIDQSKLVPLLTAALQEAIGEIESLKARVAALESA